MQENIWERENEKKRSKKKQDFLINNNVTLLRENMHVCPRSIERKKRSNAENFFVQMFLCVAAQI